MITVRLSLNTYRPIIPVLMEHGWSIQAHCDQYTVPCHTKWKEEVLLKENTNKRDASSIIEQSKLHQKNKTKKIQEHLIVKHFTCYKTHFMSMCLVSILFWFIEEFVLTSSCGWGHSEGWSYSQVWNLPGPGNTWGFGEPSRETTSACLQVG